MIKIMKILWSYSDIALQKEKKSGNRVQKIREIFGISDDKCEMHQL